MPLAGPPEEVLAELSHTGLVSRMMQADTEAMGEFHRRFIRGLQYLLYRQGLSHADAEDLAQETIWICIRQIQKGYLLNPACLAGYVRKVALREVFAKRKDLARELPISPVLAATVSCQRLNPEQRAQAEERSALIRQGLARLKRKEVEILTRFYLQGQDREQIMREMGLTDTQFRLNKCRAKARLAAQTRRIAAKPKWPLLDKKAA